VGPIPVVLLLRLPVDSSPHRSATVV